MLLCQTYTDSTGTLSHLEVSEHCEQCVHVHSIIVPHSFLSTNVNDLFIYAFFTSLSTHSSKEILGHSVPFIHTYQASCTRPGST